MAPGGAWRWLETGAGAAAALTAAVWLVCAAARIPTVLAQLRSDGDAVAAQVLGEWLGRTPDHGTVYLAADPNYVTILADSVVAPHQAVWEWGPMVVAVLTVGSLGWTAARVAGRWAAALTVMGATCVTPVVLHSLVGQSYHGLSLLLSALCGAALVGQATSRARPGLLAVGTAGLGLIAGVIAASDALAWVIAVGPFGAVSVLRLLRRRERLVPVLGVAAVGLAGAVAALTTWLMHRAGYVSSGGAPGVAPLRDLPGHVRLLAGGFARVGGGEDLHVLLHTHDAASLLHLAATLVVAAAVAAVLAVAIWLLFRAARTRVSPTDPLHLLVLYWASSGALLMATFLLSSLTIDAQSARYLPPLLLVGAAVVPALVARWQVGALRAAVASAAALIAASSTVATVHAVDVQGFSLLPGASYPPVLDALRARGLDTGYAPYFDAFPLSYLSGTTIAVRPVFTDDALCPRTLCGGPVNHAADWYGARARAARSFLLVDPALPAVDHIPPALGRPVETFRADRFTVFVFDHDVGSEVIVPSGR